jgi:hypothetical protein
MATSTKSQRKLRKALFDYYVYAPLGAGQLLIEKARELPGKAKSVSAWRQDLSRAYRDLAERGEKLVSGIRRSAYTQRAMDQTKTAQSQVKAARTSVGKAVRTTERATRAAARKVG